MNNFTRERWDSLTDRLDLPECYNFFKHIHSAYSEPSRLYHNVKHIEDCLGWFDTVKEHCEYPDEVEFSLWLHDVVYFGHRKDNESRSATYAADILRYTVGEPARTIRVKANIISTAHHLQPTRLDARLTADIDLIILGQNVYRYCEFEIAIRKEYMWVPFSTFVKKRLEVLQAFLDRDRIYSTDVIHEQYEETARDNLTNTIYRLEAALWAEGGES